MARESKSEEEDGFTEVKWNFKDRVAGLSYFFFILILPLYIFYNFVLNLGGRNRGREKDVATKWG